MARQIDWPNLAKAYHRKDELFRKIKGKEHASSSGSRPIGTRAAVLGHSPSAGSWQQVSSELIDIGH
uniref:Uncharacterized protein n=1 Tax=Oryza glumipatula TaxID=40148 RepID=A0A0D9Y6V2_9ORYZ